MEYLYEAIDISSPKPPKLVRPVMQPIGLAPIAHKRPRDEASYINREIVGPAFKKAAVRQDRKAVPTNFRPVDRSVDPDSGLPIGRSTSSPIRAEVKLSTRPGVFTMNVVSVPPAPAEIKISKGTYKVLETLVPKDPVVGHFDITFTPVDKSEKVTVKRSFNDITFVIGGTEININKIDQKWPKWTRARGRTIMSSPGGMYSLSTPDARFGSWDDQTFIGVSGACTVRVYVHAHVHALSKPSLTSIYSDVVGTSASPVRLRISSHTV